MFESYMETLFSKATNYVGIYSSDFNIPVQPSAPHVRHRHFTAWIKQYRPDWRLCLHIPNAFPSIDITKFNSGTSFCDFFFFEKRREVS